MPKLGPTLVLLLLPAPFAAPQVLATSSPAVFRIPPGADGCPVGLSVEKTSPTEIVNASDAARHQGSQRIRLIVDPRETSGIRLGELNVHAASPRQRLVPLASQAPNQEIDRSFHLSGDAIAGLREKMLWIDGVGAVLSVDLTSITYIDGSTWRRSAASTCRAVPNNLLLVGAR